MNIKYVIGIDEAGRGPLAGPVSVSVVLMTFENYQLFKKNIRNKKWLLQNNLPVLHDSKKLSEKNREIWFKKIKQFELEKKLIYRNVLIDSKQIDQKGIAVVIRKGIEKMLQDLENKNLLEIKNTRVLLDGSLKAPAKYLNQKTIIKGDELEPIISLASIVSKVTRDHKMLVLAKKYPQYGLEIHKGYGTQKHRDLIKKHGLSEIHRCSFCQKIWPLLPKS